MVMHASRRRDMRAWSQIDVGRRQKVRRESTAVTRVNGDSVGVSGASISVSAASKHWRSKQVQQSAEGHITITSLPHTTPQRAI